MTSTDEDDMIDLERIGIIIDKNDRIKYWAVILELTDDALWEATHSIDEKHYTAQDIDTYVKKHYAEELKKPEVIARMLGSKE